MSIGTAIVVVDALASFAIPHHHGRFVRREVVIERECRVLV
jgi:hypothetical protein